MNHKSQNRKLYEVSSKKDWYNYDVARRDWEVPQDAANATLGPVMLDTAGADISEERFVWLKDYSFSDEGENVKVYVNFPAEVGGVLMPSAVSVEFGFESFDLRFTGSADSYRLRLEPLWGSINAEQCRHRVSSGSAKVTLTLKKRHVKRHWPALLKS